MSEYMACVCSGGGCLLVGNDMAIQRHGAKRTETVHVSCEGLFALADKNLNAVLYNLSPYTSKWMYCICIKA